MKINFEYPTWKEAWFQTKSSVKSHRKVLLIATFLFLVCSIFPSNLFSYRDNPPIHAAGEWLSVVSTMPIDESQKIIKDAVDWVEHRGRYISTAAQIIIPIVLMDRVGLFQLLYSGLATTSATHIFKRLKNHIHIGETRIGERPSGGRHNMPSGHSSMAGSAMGFIWRRYGSWHLWYLLPILLATMLTRVLLSAHTISAVLAGAILGVVLTYAMTTPKTKPAVV